MSQRQFFGLMAPEADVLELIEDDFHIRHTFLKDVQTKIEEVALRGKTIKSEAPLFDNLSTA
jgi:hypothetical protein